LQSKQEKKEGKKWGISAFFYLHVNTRSTLIVGKTDDVNEQVNWMKKQLLWLNETYGITYKIKLSAYAASKKKRI